MKRTADDNDPSFRPIESDGTKGEFHKVCKYFYGHYHGKKLLTFEVVPANARGQLKNLMRNKFPGAKELSDIPDGKHRAFDVINNCKDYNMVFYLTQRIVYTFSLTPVEAKALATTIFDEGELIRMIMSDRTFAVTVLPLYETKHVENIKYGPYVVQTVLTYINTHDRAVLDMGPKEKCYELLNDSTGVTKLEHFTDHPPIPTSPVSTSLRELVSFYQEPVPDFRMIKNLDENSGPLALDALDEVGRTPHVRQLKDPLNDMPGPEYCFIFVGSITPPPKPYIHRAMNIHIDDIEAIKKCRRTKWVFVFKNNSTLKTYNTLKHTLDDRVTRIHSLMIFIAEMNKMKVEREFMTYVKPYQ